METQFSLILLLTSAQCGVFEDVRDASIVRGIGLETDGEDIIGIIAANVQVLGTSFIVLQVQRGQLELRNGFGALQRESMKALPNDRISLRTRNGGKLASFQT